MNKGPYIFPRKVKPPRPWRDYRMEFTVTEQDYNVAEFHDNFGHALPRIVMVNQGFCGEIVGDTFDRQQVMRLHTVSKQTRVIAKFVVSGQRKLVSIPVSYAMKMCVLDKKGKPGAEQTLAAIVKENTLPVHVQFLPDQTISVASQTISSNRIPKMELVQTFDEMYFLSNFIIDGVLTTEVTPVPLYLKQLRLVEVTGIQGQTREKWNSFCEQLNTACQKLHYDIGFGNSEVAVYDPSANYADTTYSYVEPTIYSPMHSFFKRPGLSNQTYTVTEEHEGGSDPRTDVYEEIGDARLVSQTKRILKYSELTHVNETGQIVHQAKRPIVVAPPVAPKPVLKQAGTSTEAPALPARKPTPVATDTVQPMRVHENNYSNVATKFIPTDRQPVPKAPPFLGPIPRQTTVTPDRSNPLTGTTEIVKPPEKALDVARLTIDEVCEYLKELNLGQYVDKFKAHLVDGSILSELGKNDLQQDFGFKAVEAIRLKKFAETGHVPS